MPERKRRIRRMLIIVTLLTIIGGMLLLRIYRNSERNYQVPVNSRLHEGNVSSAISGRTDDVIHLRESLVTAGDAWMRSNNADSAAAIYAKALHLKPEHDRRVIVCLYLRLTGAFNANGLYDSTLSVLTRLDSARIGMTTADSVCCQIRLLDAYSGKHQWSAAARYCDRLNTVLQNEAYDSLSASAYEAISRYNIARRHYGAARRFIRLAENIYIQKKVYYGLNNVYNLEFTLDTAEHKPERAFATYNRYRKLSDSIVLMDKEKHIAAMEAGFNADLTLRDKLNAQDIEVLRAGEKLQEAELKQSQIRTFVLLAGTIALGALLLICFIVYRMKKGNEILLEEQKRKTDIQYSSLKTMVGSQQQLIREKEWLVKQVHQRVEANLQIISCLLNYQSKFLLDAAAIEAIRDSEHRVRTMSFIHQRLYLTDSLQYVDMDMYVNELITYMNEAMQLSPSVHFNVSIAPVEMDISQAVPIGLILNEAITNATKYAFVDRDHGRISLLLTRKSPTECYLLIADDGAGLPKGFNWTTSNTLGFMLIHTMAEQLGAEISIKGTNGVEISLSFTLRGEKIPQQLTNNLSYA
ncbi:sensor histidine kinase [Chitinophaga sp. CF418]|uniref:sensor histidine kinase n=1 Tax=Chitinophaga sp. CF418 TaxID=1855287 RepID=UPI000918DB33|nr:histidine kinase dimerization/phosphoacceptor domain -containing protein [Chitinophaga sp. CF418]SHN36007.1 Two-component sensor histidine kinase, contains HisKA and HATPase domains [Chitinophaga sp. CF418]